jgi:uncharacterized membrane protein
MWKALTLLGFVAWQWLAHLAASEGSVGPLRLILLMLPLVALACWVVVHARDKTGWFLLLLAAGAITYALAREGGHDLAPAAYGVPHAAGNLFLLWFFGRTLRPGRDALITRLARRVHGGLPPDMEGYTRRLTVAWCVFFAAQVAVSVLLFAFASIDAWSIFINILNVPLVVLMFIGEYFYRVVRYRDFPHASIATAWRAFASDPSLSSGAKAR